MPRASTSTGADDRLRRTLRSTFPRANHASIDRLIETHTRREARQGDAIDTMLRGPEMLLVVEGHVAFAQYAPDGRVSYLGVYGSGTFVGLATVDGEEQPLELEALGPVVMLGWPAELVRTIAQGDPGFLIDLVDHLAYRVRLGLLLLQRQTFAPARARLASFLLRNESLVSAPTSRLLRRHMAALAGVSREMVGRILRRWEREGIVERVDGGLVLVDRDRLEEEAAAADDLAPEPRLTVPPAA